MNKTVFACTRCGGQSLKWAGRCPECGGWGTLVEENQPDKTIRQDSKTAPGKTQAFATLADQTAEQRMATGLPAWDRLLSGGLVAGSVTLLGGEPGIGKSTLIAQLALIMAERGLSVLYVTGEESPAQVALRLRRLSPALPATLMCLDQTQADVIAATIRSQKPALTIVDSIQTVRLDAVPGEAGNPSQLKACGAILSEAAKQSSASVILIGQVTKDGELAGPRLLEHLVDTVMMMEGDRNQPFRILRVLKHRFGNTDELTVFSMTEQGLQEIADPSAALLAHRPQTASGSVVTCLAQGSRPLLVELQALVTSAGYGTPLRRATGIDTNRLSLLLAVLARRAGVSLAEQDVFVNAVGGIEAKEPAVDLALVAALVSAKYDIPIAPNVAVWGEVGLSGEIRPVTNPAGRLKEAERLGFTTVVAPKGQLSVPKKMQIIQCATVRETLEILKLHG